MHRRFLAAALLALPAAASAASPDLVVSQVYGAGGNSGASYSHDFVELFNRGQADVSLGDKSIQYASATGTGNFGTAAQITELPALTLRPGEYLLVQEGGNLAVGDPLAEGRNRRLYTTTLSPATHFVYPPQNYLNDMDPGYYSADYLRAWITEAMLRRNLEETYGEDWFTRPEAGEFLRGLWATGEKQENEDVARAIGREPFDTSCLIEQFLGLPTLS